MSADRVGKKAALLMFSPLSAGAGAEKYFIEVAKNLTDKGLSIDVVTLGSASYKKYVRLMHIYYYFNIFKKIDLNISIREKDSDVLEKLGKASWVRHDFLTLADKLAEYDVVYVKNEILELLYLKMCRMNTTPLAQF